jgi:hypothetical protein
VLNDFDCEVWGINGLIELYDTARNEINTADFAKNTKTIQISGKTEYLRMLKLQLTDA